MSLLSDVTVIYGRVPDAVRGVLNATFFTKVYLDARGRVTEHDLREPFATFVGAGSGEKCEHEERPSPKTGASDVALIGLLLSTEVNSRSSSSKAILAEALGRYSNLGDTGVKVRSVRNRVAKNVRSEPWRTPELVGGNRTRQILAGHESSVRAEYEAGMGSVTLSRKYGVPVNTLLGWLRREGVEIRGGGKLSTNDMAEVMRLRSDGWSHQRIADQFGVSRSTVSLRLTRETLRGCGEQRG